ncbi:tetrapyrrole methylase family protein / MazG family protein [Geoalkalibacter ferrihydriticus]|uniref:Tetrapyrrole methylase family protein / MazG family protein n=1 Tax=Geoalkalibacter ferrihydriticus TaxID=392333 RepID=A0A1G9R540_9BACT|nr:MazG family protein [Geoalkalibacter ferrihydriticus]SDM17545.1 tetrapyrrole methylase family protein / MazG family protein [Geoalkalibacter ferrihydriticus]
MKKNPTAFLDLVEIMQRLRAPNGCPWDREQTTQSLKPYLLEETYEVLEAVDLNDPSAICEELGDLLLQVVFLAQIFAEQGLFTVEEVARGITDKLIRRHPHVFADGECSDLKELNRQWEQIKSEEKRERGDTAPRKTAPRNLPALARAHKVLPPPGPGEHSILHAQILNCLARLENQSPKNRELSLGQAYSYLVALGQYWSIDSEQALRRYLNCIEEGCDAKGKGGKTDGSQAS